MRRIIVGVPLLAEHAPSLPDAVLEAWYTGAPTVEELAETLGSDEPTAAHWHTLASVWLLPPSLYAPLFEAEDQIADCRSQRTAFLADCKQMDDRLAALDEQIAVSKNYGLLSEQHAAEMAPRIQAMDEERLTLLRALERDVPRQRELLAQEERAVQDRLQTAQDAITRAFAVQVDALSRSIGSMRPWSV
jgi:hypothetical protein